jgi:hypothetical protein
MTDNYRVLASIEAAQHGTPFCTCGAPTVLVGHARSVWLECSTLGQHRSALRRLLALDLAADHTRRLVVDLAADDTTRLEAAA